MPERQVNVAPMATAPTSRSGSEVANLATLNKISPYTGNDTRQRRSQERPFSDRRRCTLVDEFAPP